MDLWLRKHLRRRTQLALLGHKGPRAWDEPLLWEKVGNHPSFLLSTLQVTSCCHPSPATQTLWFATHRIEAEGPETSGTF